MEEIQKANYKFRYSDMILIFQDKESDLRQDLARFGR